jgi:hypothetical protein
VPKVPKVALILLALWAADASAQTTFDTRHPSEALATIAVRCDDCAWDVAGREAVVLRVALDGRYVQHLPLVRSGLAEYDVLLGAVEPGTHTVRVEEEGELSARGLRDRRALVERIVVRQVAEGSPEHTALSLAPFLYARPDTVGRFTDVPILMWYEIEPTPRGTRYRYSVIFTNEDGGTPADRLMATWGRTTDIEYVYSVEVDARGGLLGDDMQGPEHEILPFRGRREGRHPLLWVSTSNNMVLDAGSTSIRYAPAPSVVSLANVSREVVMDQHAWTYDVMARELTREGKIVPGAPPGNGTIPDPRRYAYVEGCGEVGDAALAFAVRLSQGQWLSSDRGVDGYRITRDGCFRAAVPLPPTATLDDVRAVRLRAFARGGRTGRAPARILRLNMLFMLDERFVPGRSILSWQGTTELRPGGSPLEIPVK